MICTVQGCEKIARGHGWCSAHYTRWRNHGDPLGGGSTRKGSPEPRFWEKVNKDGPVPEHRPELGPCWVWTAHLHGHMGYGRFAVKNSKVLAHRFAYELLVGPIPEGLTIDHLCRNPPCVNPTHMEPVPGDVNTMRGETIPAHHARKTHCPAGHAYDEANTRHEAGKRRCRRCERERARRRRGK